MATPTPDPGEVAKQLADAVANLQAAAGNLDQSAEPVRVQLDSDDLALLIAQAAPDALRRLARSLAPLIADDLLIRLLTVLRDEGR